jgi:hypothetical protein
MAAVLGSIVLTVSMVTVWPVAVGSLAPGEGIWTGAASALADDETPQTGWYEVGTSESGRPVYRYYDQKGWGSFTTSYPWMIPLIHFFANELWANHFTASFVTAILIYFLIDPDDESGAQRPPSSPPMGEPAIPDPPTASTASDRSCDARFYRGTPSVKMKGTKGKLTPAVARADVWVSEDCSVRVELVWQAAWRSKELATDWCQILVATGTGTSTPRDVFPQRLEGDFEGGTAAIDLACPAKDCPGKIEWLNGGKRDVGQVGAYLVPTQTGLVGPRTTFYAEVVEDGTLKVEPLAFENSYMVFKVKRLLAKPQEPPPDPTTCPAN